MAEAAPLLSRRALLAWSVFAAGFGLTGCAGAGVVRADIGRRPADPVSAPAAVQAVAAFSRDLVAALLATDEANLVCSPFSVLAVLAMVRNGATGETASEMDAALHLPATAQLNAGLNAVEQTLAARSGRRRTADDGEAEVALAVAQQVWGQRDLAWQPAFLDVLAASYGTGVRTLDIAADPEAARRTVNAWVADATEKRIRDLLAPGILQPDTHLVLAKRAVRQGAVARAVRRPRAAAVRGARRRGASGDAARRPAPRWSAWARLDGGPDPARRPGAGPDRSAAHRQPRRAARAADR